MWDHVHQVEVCDLEYAIRSHQQIVQLDVCMHDLVLLEHVERLRQHANEVLENLG